MDEARTAHPQQRFLGKETLYFPRSFKWNFKLFRPAWEGRKKKELGIWDAIKLPS